MKKMLLTVAVIAALLVVSPTVVSAANDWLLDCTVNSIGAGADDYYFYLPVQLTCPDNGSKNYSIKGTDMAAKNRVLATILTALSTEKTIRVFVDEKTAAEPGIRVLRVQKE